MILYFASLAILNGVIIGLSRALNGRLGIGIGAIGASVWNHIIGFSFLTCVLLIGMPTISWGSMTQIPLVSFIGGFIGAVFVAVNSYVFPKLGAARTLLMVTSGQLIFGIYFDYMPGHLVNTVIQIIGAGVIMLAIYIDKMVYPKIIKEKNKGGLNANKTTTG